MNNAIPVFVGYDPSEDQAARACVNSLLRNSTIPLHVQYLNRRALEWAGLYSRQFERIGNQRYDLIDKKPFSTDFSFSRFLVPALCQWTGTRAIFVDCDFIFLRDIKDLLIQCVGDYALWCVKHDYTPVESFKMNGLVQEKYYRKNWSSLMVFNLAHSANLQLTPSVVSSRTGSWLHGLEWLENREIGSISRDWNHLADVYPNEPVEKLSAIHYTLGAPCLGEAYENCTYSEEYWKYV